jgi:UDP-N-acetylglucosamine enolpyruvyl transferase
MATSTANVINAARLKEIACLVIVLCMMGLQIAGEDSMSESSGRATRNTSGMRRTAAKDC